MNKKQLSGGILLSILLIPFGYFLHSKGTGLLLHLLTGLGLGYVLSRASYGFAGGIRLLYLHGDGLLSRALLIMLAVTMVLTLAVHWNAANKDAIPAFVAEEGDAVIPGTGSVNPINLNLIIGGLLFGVGMTFAGGCASGTLSSFGTGSGRGLIAIIFFGVGGLIGDIMLPGLKTSFMEKGPIVYLPEKLGYIGAFIISMIFILITYGLVQSYESKRRKNNTFIPIWTPEEEPAVTNNYKFFSLETYNTILGRPWKLVTGALMLSVLFGVIIITTNNNWGVSGPYAVWTARFLQIFGVNPQTGGMAKTFETAAAGILNHSSLAVLFSGCFAIDFKFSTKDAIYYAIGGILMGIGAKLAKGCNVGAFYSAIVSFSLSGWIFMITLILGSLFALKVFANKMNMTSAIEE